MPENVLDQVVAYLYTECDFPNAKRQTVPVSARSIEFARSILELFWVVFIETRIGYVLHHKARVIGKTLGYGTSN